jgi:hypothetical protein
MALPFFKQQDGRERRFHLQQTGERASSGDRPEAMGAGNVEERFRGRAARPDPMIAAQLRRAQMGAAIPRGDG